jgi:putative MATE family efflux protein
MIDAVNERGAGHRRGLADLTRGVVGTHLITLGVFLAISVVSIMSISLVDIYFVARLGAHALAALSFTFPLVLITGAISVGFGNAVIGIVARAVGEGDHDTIRVLGTDSICLAVVLVTTLSTAGYFTIEPLFKLLGADPEVMPLIIGYMHIWYIGAALQIIPQVGQSVIRAHGDTRTPSYITMSMGVLNVILDPILIFGLGPIPAFGLNGAAIAGILARILSVAGVLGVLHFRLHALAPLSLSLRRLRTSWTRLLHIGLPSTLTQLVSPISAAVVTKVVAHSGTLAVAAFGIGSRIEQLAAIYLWAVAGSMPAFVGQNAGAGRMDRVHAAIHLAIKFCLGAGLVVVALAMLSGSWIVSQFTHEGEIHALALFYIRAAAISNPLAGLVLIGSQTMYALRRPLPAATLSLCRTFVVLIPFALIGQWLGQVHGLFIGIAAAGAACGVSAWVTLLIVLAQETRRHLQPMGGTAEGGSRDREPAGEAAR